MSGKQRSMCMCCAQHPGRLQNRTADPAALMTARVPGRGRPTCPDAGVACCSTSCNSVAHLHVERLEGGAARREGREGRPGDPGQLPQRQAAQPRRRGQARQPGVRHRRRLRQRDRLQLLAHVESHLRAGRAQPGSIDRRCMRGARGWHLESRTTATGKSSVVHDAPAGGWLMRFGSDCEIVSPGTNGRVAAVQPAPLCWRVVP